MLEKEDLKMPIGAGLAVMARESRATREFDGQNG